MGRGECHRGPDNQFRRTGRGRLAGHLAPEFGPTDAGDPDQKDFTREFSCPDQMGELDDSADLKPANLLPQFDVINALSAPH